ncbi:hypothetical protein DAEQUDRAFT_768034 [Daedalea quercina L-15889]|uniref:Transposase Tc1-like domain-containing protein n=1 Tax=Daedalea quercina L-15889 TaxID=1314783 RepID=A0A165N3A3_9APHY|nr:hypothetical protein DAEQUDRAFT_768034 [Daedalea quercina L-15889]
MATLHARPTEIPGRSLVAGQRQEDVTEFSTGLFLEGLVERQPDMFLQEPQEVLLEALNVRVSGATIYRTLRKRRFSRHSLGHRM